MLCCLSTPNQITNFQTIPYFQVPTNRTMYSTNCLNCGSAFTPDAKYCAACGQKAATHRMHFHDIWHDLIHYFTHADKGIFHLLKDLATKPGLVAREFVEGKRQKYFRPLNFFLIVAGLVVFMTSMLGKSTASSVPPASTTV